MDNALSKEMRFVTNIVQMKAEQKECRRILTVEFLKYITKIIKKAVVVQSFNLPKIINFYFVFQDSYVKEGVQNPKSKSNLHSKDMWHPSPLEHYQGVKAALTHSPDYPGNAGQQSLAQQDQFGSSTLKIVVWGCTCMSLLGGQPSIFF